jgi:hypothetical protein
MKMGKLTWEDLIKALVAVRDSNMCRSEPEHDEARRDNLEFVVLTILEKLRDSEATKDPS